MQVEKTKETTPALRLKLCPFVGKTCVTSFCAVWDPANSWCSFNSVFSIGDIANNLKKLNTLIDSLISEIKSGNKGEY